jgi:hypothetical protein
MSLKKLEVCMLSEKKYMHIDLGMICELARESIGEERSAGCM